MSIKQAKNVLRKEIQKRLSSMSTDERSEQSALISAKLLTSTIYKDGARIGIYLSTPEEVWTDDIVRNILKDGKTCFVPWFNEAHMKLVKVRSIEDYETLPKNKWNIKQPLDGEEREDCFSGGLDLIIVPGLAFSRTGERLGRGKGYYDRFLHQMKTRTLNTKLTTIGLAYKEQIVDKIPTESTDHKIDNILYP